MRQLLYIICLWVLFLPVTSLAQDEVITIDNISQIERIQTIGRGILIDAVLSPDGETLIALTPRGVYFFDANDLSILPEVVLFDEYETYDIALKATFFSTENMLSIIGDELWIHAPFLSAMYDLQTHELLETDSILLSDMSLLDVQGELLLVGADSRLILVDGITDTVEEIVDLGSGLVDFADFTADGDQVLVAGFSREQGYFVQLWNLTSMAMSGEIDFDADSYRRVNAIKATENTFLLEVDDGILVYDGETFQQIDMIRDAILLPLQGSETLFAYKDIESNNIVLMDDTTQSIIHDLGDITCTSIVPDLIFNPDGTKVFVVDKNANSVISVWDMDTGELIEHTGGFELSFDFVLTEDQTIQTAGGNHRIECSRNFGDYFHSYDLYTGEELDLVPMDWTNSSVITGDGAGTYWIGGFNRISTIIDGRATTTVFPREADPPGTLKDLEFSPNGKYLVAASDELLIWDVEEPLDIELAQRIDGGISPFSTGGQGLVWLDSTNLVYMTFDGTINRLNVESGESTPIFEYGDGYFISSFVYQDGVLATHFGTADDEFYIDIIKDGEDDLWRIPVGRLGRNLTLSPDNSVLIASISPNYDSDEPDTIVIDVEAGQPIFEIRGISGPTTFTADGKYLIGNRSSVIDVYAIP